VYSLVATCGSREKDEKMSVQISFAMERGSGAATPDLSIELDDLDAALRRMQRARAGQAAAAGAVRGSAGHHRDGRHARSSYWEPPAVCPPWRRC
jgi:hypothetical protein